MQVAGAQSCSTSSVHCTGCSPPRVRSPPTIRTPVPAFVTPGRCPSPGWATLTGPVLQLTGILVASVSRLPSVMLLRTVVVPAFCRRSFSRILGKSSVWSRRIVWYIYVHILRKCTCFPAWLSLFTSPPATCLAPASPRPHQHLAQSDFVTRALPVQV